MSKIKVGLIGAGAIASNHCAGINRHPEAEVVAVCDKSAERARALKEYFKLGKTCSDWKELVADRELDAVAIALPNALHAPVAIAALQAGKHVILDKPFALSHAQAKKVADTARAKKKVCMLGMNRRFLPQTQTLKALAERGDLGEIYHAKATWLRRSGCPKFGTWFCNKELAGGGCMLDIGVHVLDSALYLMDNWKPASVSGAVYTKFGNRGIGEGGWGRSDPKGKRFDVDDFGCGLIKFHNGATLELNASWVLMQEASADDNIRLFGTKAGACTSPVAKLYRFGKNPGEFEVCESPSLKLRYPHCERFVNWIDTILGLDRPCATLEQSLTVQKILDGLYKSSATGRETRLK